MVLPAQPQTKPIGFLSAVGQAAVQQTRAFFEDETLSLYELNGVNITMEYPIEREEYPCIQMDFLPSRYYPQNLSGGVVDEVENVKVFIFEGAIHFYLYALTHLESDRMGDGVISLLSANDSWKNAMHFNPYVAMDVNTSDVKIGQRTMSFTAPWDDDQPIYYTSFNLPVIGSFAYTESEVGYELVERIRVDITREGEDEPASAEMFDEDGTVVMRKAD